MQTGQSQSYNNGFGFYLHVLWKKLLIVLSKYYRVAFLIEQRLHNQDIYVIIHGSIYLFYLIIFMSYISYIRCYIVH
ncbi:unnamed protein product [Rotaria socialis]|uniref:Uncharacterized protein n=1 Tax=Rotaria socialis TaxID=392032 RepID=A0A817SHH5_9BILA|nr:unnamed protein product [Rotaria socialis]